MMTRVERTRAKHNEVTTQLGRAQGKRENLIGQLIKAEQRVQSLIKAVARSGKRLRKVTEEALINAPLPEPETTKADSVPLADLHKTKQGKANAESWNAIPAVRKRKSRRTPDDFKADMAGKKLATGLEDGGQV